MSRTAQVVLNLRVPRPLLAALDAYAARVGVARSTALKALAEAALRDVGLWPPASEARRGR